MIRNRKRASTWGSLCSLIVLLVCVLGTWPAHADSVVNIADNVAVMDLTVHGTRIAAQRRNLRFEVPGETDSARAVMELLGTGPGPGFNWTVYTLRNAGQVKREFVFAVDQQRFSASGVSKLVPFGSPVASTQFAVSTVVPSKLATTTAEAYRFELNPAQSITLGIEGPAALSGVRVYAASAFAQRESSLAYLRGAVTTLTFVFALGILALYGLRGSRPFLAGGFFALCALLFIALEAGYLPTLNLALSNIAFSQQHARGLVECAFAIATAILFWATASLQKRKAAIEALFLLPAALLLPAFGLAFFLPDVAASAARWSVFVVVILGFTNALLGRGQSGQVMDYAVLFWSIFLLWVFAGMVAVVGESHSPIWHAILLAGLAIVVLALAAVLFRLSFAQGFLSKPYLTDSSRRSLALTGAQHVLWDWQPQDNLLDVGIELAESLGHDAKRIRTSSAARWFAALLHPSDELAYRKTLDLRGVKAGAFIEQELRLRDGGGAYHWYVLRAQTLPGAGGNAARLIGTLTDIDRAKQQEDKLITESIMDPVTGLPTRALFLDRVEQDMAKPMALPRRLLMIGIERFKILNEGLGPDLGDQLLLAVGQRLSEGLRPEESVARISGSRFAVMHVENIAARTAQQLAADIVQRLAAPFTVLSQEVFLSACVGISLSSTEHRSVAKLQQQAETALHEAQSKGPRTIIVFDEKIEDERVENIAMETDLRRALARNEIEVFYQPIVHLVTREVAGLEALARWRHPTRGILAPSDFIGLAEQTGLIREVGDLVLSEAVRQMGIWQRVLTRSRPIFISINVSSDQLSDTGFLDRLNTIIAREGVLTYAIKIEITESVVMRYPQRARQLIQKLRNMGIGVACDDFGTGFSNLASLRELAFDTLKIDRSFISAEGLEGRGGVILQSVVNMSHSLGMAVVAEGIETEAQAQHLLQLGCELGQGFALGQPMAARDVHGLLAVLPVLSQAAQASHQVAAAEFNAFGAPLRQEVEWDSDEEPEELPSLFNVYNPKPKKKKAKKAAKRSSASSRAKKKSASRRR